MTTLDTITYEAPAYYDTARWTLRSLIPYLLGDAEVVDEDAPTDDAPWWSARLVHRINDTEVSWYIQVNSFGLAYLNRSVSFLTPDEKPVNHTAHVDDWNLNGVTRESFSSLICEAIVGLPFVPMSSRKEAKEWWNVARQDAEYIYRTGMKHILAKGAGGAGWTEGEVGEQWDAIHDAAQTVVGHALGDHKSLLRNAGVVVYSWNVYEDGFHERAYELMQEAGLGARS